MPAISCSVKPLSAQLADLSVRAKKVEEDVAAAEGSARQEYGAQNNRLMRPRPFRSKKSTIRISRQPTTALPATGRGEVAGLGGATWAILRGLCSNCRLAAGSLQVVITTLVVVGAALFQNFSLTAAFVLGGALAVSSTAVGLGLADQVLLLSGFSQEAAAELVTSV